MGGIRKLSRCASVLTMVHNAMCLTSLLLLACSGPSSDTPSADDPGSGLPTDSDPVVIDDDTAPKIDTALARVELQGQATADADAYTGTEALDFSDRKSGDVLCHFVWQALGWDNDPGASGPDPIGPVCVDPDGSPCAWGFTVRLSDGQPAQGDRCAELGLPETGSAGEGVGWGWHADYLGLGPSTMYYDAVFGGGWLATSSGEYTPSDGSFSYALLQGYRAYAL